MADELSRLVAEVEAVGAGLAARVVTLEEHHERVAQLEAQGLAREWVRDAEDLEAFIASNNLLDELLEGWPAVLVEKQFTGWWAACVECEWKAGPCEAEAEAQGHAQQHDRLTRFRARFTDSEWELYEDGKCCWQNAYDMPWIEYCGQPSMPGQLFGYCREHDREMREQGGEAAGEAS